MSRSLLDTADMLLGLAQRNGAVHADALAVADTDESVQVRNGNVESIEREDAQGVGLRVFVTTPRGLAFATASSADVSDQGLATLAEQCITMARISEPDPDAVPPVGAQHPTAAELELWSRQHPVSETPWNTDAAKMAALECEETARSHSTKITNSEGASAGFGYSKVAYAATDGFCADFAKTSVSLSVSVIAGSNASMQRDYAWDQAKDANGLRKAADIGHEAATRAIRRLGASDWSGGKFPVVFEPRVATSLLQHLASAINGKAVLQERSFLADCLGQMVFPEQVSITDNPDHEEGLGNRLFDGEGTRCRRLELIRQGRLISWLTNRYTAKRLNHPETGHASRGLTGDIGISTSNLIWQPGDRTAETIWSDIGKGLLITELIGFGVNGVTGDYSRGAVGFLIENGKLGRPVHNITIAGNLKDMFAGVTHVGSDLQWFGSVACPSIAISGMTIAGQR